MPAEFPPLLEWEPGMSGLLGSIKCTENNCCSNVGNIRGGKEGRACMGGGRPCIVLQGGRMLGGKLTRRASEKPLCT